MANGELLIFHINQVQFYTYQYLTYVTTPKKYTVRDVDFRAGSVRFIQVLSNLDLTDEDKESLLAQLDFMNLDHLDLPVNYKAMIEAIVPIPKTCLHIKSDFEYAGHKLAAAVSAMATYFVNAGYELSTLNLTDYIVDLGTGDTAQETACLTNICTLIQSPGLFNKLSKITSYSAMFNKEFPSYTTDQLACMGYLTQLYSAYKSDSYKPNSLPYLAIRN